MGASTTLVALATLLLSPRPSPRSSSTVGPFGADLPNRKTVFTQDVGARTDDHKAEPLSRRTSSSVLPKRVTALEAAATHTEESLNALYENSFKIKCPFFRRRAFDTIEALKRVFVFVLSRHKSIPFFPSPVAKSPIRKTQNLPMVELAALVQKDWLGKRPHAGKGYYVTGALTPEIYDEECLFDGPDPDMPVRGLRKYLVSASQLFDTQRSRADLIRPIEYDIDKGVITATWRIQGVLNLPWHPIVKPWTGRTEYHIDAETGLIILHQEHWDISVPDAFISTLFPSLHFGAPAAPPLRDSVVDPPKRVHSV